MTKVIQPRPFNLRKTLTVLAVLAVAFYFYYQRPPPLQLWKISGAAWSPYSIKLLARDFQTADVQDLKKEIDALLGAINQQVSTYVPDSEISQFNRARQTEPMIFSPRFAAMTAEALRYCRETGGAFNPTLDPLINAWGFGHQGPRKTPTDEEIQAALALAGCDLVEARDGSVMKRNPDVQLNLNAIAEGWAVDEVATLLAVKGVTNYFVEIGGEVYARGHSERMRPWRVGVDRPVDGAMPGEHVDLIVEVDGRGLATSGHYRNFVTDETGRKIAHLLDPRTGQPATSSLASVTVLAPTCAEADALATALFVMGVDDGRAWLHGRTNVFAAFIEHDGTGFRSSFSEGFESFVVPPGP